MKKTAIFAFLTFFIINGLFSQENSMVHIDGGTFTMGVPANEAESHEDKVLRQIRLSAFSMSKYLITQKEFENIMGINPSFFKGDNLPVEQITWFDAIEYCIKRSQKEGLSPAYTMTNRKPETGYPITSATVTANWNANGYRLPTEAEWEYACRAGTKTPFSTGNNITTDQANYDGNSPYRDNPIGKFRETTTAVGSFPANPWGLYDMHGNVWEWCWDRHGRYPNGGQTDPRGPNIGDVRILRGGNWNGQAQYLRSSYRNADYPHYKNRNVGFRVVLPV
jgi:formylglycine-generating enzyme required for sulfatase activity